MEYNMQTPAYAPPVTAGLPNMPQLNMPSVVTSVALAGVQQVHAGMPVYGAYPAQPGAMPVQPGYLQPEQQVVALTQEDLVLRVFFQDTAIAPKIRGALRPSLFKDGNNRNIVDIINRYENQHSRLPTAQELITGMGQNEYALQARDKLIFIYNTPIQTMHQDFVVLMIENFFRERLAEEVLISVAESIHDKHVDGIHDLVPRLHSAVNFSLHTDLGLNFYSDIEVALAKLREQKQCIPSGINEVRYYTGRPDADGTMCSGGYYRKTLSLLVGQPNIGKSLALCSEAAYAYKNGYNVLYITLELAEDYVWQRLAANITGTEFYKVITMSGEEIRAKIDQSCADMANVGERHGQLQVKYMKTTTTPVEIEAVIDSFEIAHGKLDLLVVDYIGIMKPSYRGKISESSMYSDGVMKAEQLRDIAIERNFACLSAVQFNRTGYHNTEAGIESVEGSSGYAETADFMMSLTSNDVARGLSMYLNYIMKSRLGPANVSFCTSCDFKTMTWTTATDEKQNAYKSAMAEAEPQINAPQRSGKGGGPKRASSKPPELQNVPGGVELPKMSVNVSDDMFDMVVAPDDAEDSK